MKTIEKIEIDPEILVGGLKINYFIHCKTQLWLFSHFLSREKESDLVIIGKILHETFFKNVNKDVLIDDKISIDFIKKENKLILHDIKKSDKFQSAHYYQMLYYLYYLKNEKGIENVEGEINYPLKRKTVKVELTKEKEDEIKKILQKINEIVSQPKPPRPIYKKYCRNCAYFEFCFGD